MVADALRHFDNQRYSLFAWCVMPNHVHVLVRVFPGHTLAEVVHSWKSFSAKRANELLNHAGSFWQREYYDHLIQDESEFERAVRYVAENPEKAGLRNWRWVWVGGRDAHPTAGGTPALPEPEPSVTTVNPAGGTASDRSAAVSRASGPRGPFWATLIATFFGVGRLRPGPGTWGSATTVLLWWLLARSIAPAGDPGWQ